ncbi:hypothetical protein H2509_14455 [Stappia sp. F7233]|uniref:AsmA family protein n=1 Tax=Stappia albiluteola TaxID=2758565 RepID=A0A839AH16_9HYPH|nr:hypothetical protein [Stappia albiluteola]MBA5778328.1 hypothetical protein [Stappia albiluteola]
MPGKHARTIRRAALAAVGLAAMALATGLLLPLLLSSDAAKDRVEAALSNWLGVSVTIAGDHELRFIPDARLTLNDIHLASQDGLWRLDAPRLTAHLDLFGLVLGKVSASTFELQEPRIETAYWRSSRTDVPSLSQQVQHELARLFRYRLKLNNGQLRGKGSAPGEAVTNIDLSLSANEGKNAILRAKFEYHAHPFELRLTLSDIAMLNNKAPGELAASLVSPVISAKLAGRTIEGDGRVIGTLDLSTSDLRRLSREMGADFPHRASFGAARLSGQGTFNGNGAEFDQLRIDIDGNSGEGRLAIRPFGVRPTIEGTLAFDRVDATAYLDDLKALFDRRNQASPNLTGLLDAADIDLRMSALSIELGHVTLGRTGLAFLMREDDLVVDISEAELIGGTGRGHLRLSPDALPLHSLDIELNAANIEMANLPLADATVTPNGGKASLSLRAKSTGTTLADLAGNLGGKIAGSIDNPRVSGLDLGAEVARMNAAARAGIVSNSGSARQGLKLEADFSPQEMQIEKLSWAAAGYLIDARGKLQFVDGGLALRAKARTLPSADAETEADAGAPYVPFLIRGTWRQPKLLPDLKGVSQAPAGSD